MNQTYIFGYGSLIAASGINGRGMRRKYNEEDITECLLSSYKREFNALCEFESEPWDEDFFAISVRYFGVRRDINSATNGVLFPIEKRDWAPFALSESGGKIYAFVDVTSLISFPYADANILRRGDKVITCIPHHPVTTRGIVTSQYIHRCQKALNMRSVAFQNDFGDMKNYL